MKLAREEALHLFQKKYNLTFQNPKLLQQAFVHSSWKNESQIDMPDNQRLEYLGDSVLELIVNHFLYTKYLTFDEGQLSQIKASIVSEEPLAKIAKEMELGKLILLGRGEKNSGGNRKNSNLSDCLEALIAAIYIDQGFSICKSFVLNVFQTLLDKKIEPTQLVDSKTMLQELLQKEKKGLPEYRIITSQGPDHKKQFEVAVFIRQKEVARGHGSAIKKAQIDAAKNAMHVLKS